MTKVCNIRCYLPTAALIAAFALTIPAPCQSLPAATAAEDTVLAVFAPAFVADTLLVDLSGGVGRPSLADAARTFTAFRDGCDASRTRFAARPYRFRPVQLLLPAALIGTGIIGLESDWVKSQNHEVRDELQENIERHLRLDDFTQYAPIVALYVPPLFGVKGRHSAGGRTILLSTSALLMALTVNSPKALTRVERPDGSSRNSFPSGHTATAFMGAELLRREYRDTSPWIGRVGYVVAAGTGFFRMYNNRHWLTDVMAGAGVGILSAEAAYWLYPVLSKCFLRRRGRTGVQLMPYVGDRERGLAVHLTF